MHGLHENIVFTEESVVIACHWQLRNGVCSLLLEVTNIRGSLMKEVILIRHRNRGLLALPYSAV